MYGSIEGLRVPDCNGNHSRVWNVKCGAAVCLVLCGEKSENCCVEPSANTATMVTIHFWIHRCFGTGHCDMTFLHFMLLSYARLLGGFILVGNFGFMNSGMRSHGMAR